MPNYLKMPKKSQVLALLELGWSYRRIERETGVRRETVAGYEAIRRANAAKTFPGSDLPPPADSGDVDAAEGSNPAKTFAGSDPNPAKTFPGSEAPGRFAAARYHDAIVEKRAQAHRPADLARPDRGIRVRHSYESVKRYLRTIAPRGRPVGVFESDPGQEGQVDFFRGAPTLDATTGQWKRPWVFRLTLSCSRHGYEEAVWDQQLETFLRLHEHAFRDLGGVPTVVTARQSEVRGPARVLLRPRRQRGLRRVCAALGLYAAADSAAAPGRKREAGAQRRVRQRNALKGRRFDSLEAQTPFSTTGIGRSPACAFTGRRAARSGRTLSTWSSRRCGRWPPSGFPLFKCGERTVHPDGHVEVDGAYIRCPARCSARTCACSGTPIWCASFIATRSSSCTSACPPASTAPMPGQRSPETTTRQQAFMAQLLGRCARGRRAAPPVGGSGARRARRPRHSPIQGVLGLTRKHPREAVLRAATTALTHRLFRYKHLGSASRSKPCRPRRACR